MAGRLAGKVALITGSTSGIGRATAELFAREGASVVVNGRRAALGEEVAEGIREAGGKASFYQANVAEPPELRDLVAHAVATFGGLDVLMNNSYAGTLGRVTELTEEEWDQGITLMLKATFLGCKFAIPHMTARGGGSIINTSSVHGVLAARRFLPYDAGQAGMINLTRQVAVDYGHDGIRVNALCPGFIEVEKSKSRIEENPGIRDWNRVLYPVGRHGVPLDVAQAALFLASDESSFITGQALMVDGGLTIQLQDSLAEKMAEAVLDGQIDVHSWHRGRRNRAANTTDTDKPQ
jgi:NAD(P)-dependent dehydrogenase (short-subunit alcohol dehydrogenase family)